MNICLMNKFKSLIPGSDYYVWNQREIKFYFLLYGSNCLNIIIIEKSILSPIVYKAKPAVSHIVSI